MMTQAKIAKTIAMLGATGMGTVITFVAGRTVTSYARIAGIARITRRAARIAHFRWLRVSFAEFLPKL